MRKPKKRIHLSIAGGLVFFIYGCPKTELKVNCIEKEKKYVNLL